MRSPAAAGLHQRRTDIGTKIKAETGHQCGNEPSMPLPVGCGPLSGQMVGIREIESKLQPLVCPCSLPCEL